MHIGGVDDPAKATGTDAEINASFENAYSILRGRIEAFMKLDLSELKGDTLTKQLSLIGAS